MAGGNPASRYDTILKLASGGMATVWVGTVRGALGFRQLVAIKKPHRHLLDDPAFRSELVAEARLASMIHHANVVDVRDVEIEGDSISLVMDYIEGASLGELLVAASRKDARISPRAAVRIALDALAGLHAAHELVDERGRFVGLVHRDVSPVNILVGSDGMARVADFGVAKFARKNMQSTSEGSLKGKLAYMAPEYVKGMPIDRRFDLFAMGIVLWEALTGRRCFRADNEAETLHRLLEHEPEPVSRVAPEVGPALDAVIACALAKAREDRFENAAAMAAALEASAASAGLLAGHSEVAAAVKHLVGAQIEERRALVRGKLANEPSVASLLGVPGPEPAKEAGPPTQIDPPTATAATPKMGGGQGAPSTEKQATAPSTITAGAIAATTAVPSTKPMTPRMDGAPERLAAMPIAATLPVAGYAEAARATPPPGPIAATHLSAGVMAPPVNTLRSDVSDPQLSFQDASHRAYTAPELPPDESVVPKPRRWVLPLFVGVGSAALAGVVIFVAASRSGWHGPSTGSTAPASSTASTATAETAAPTATTSSTAAPAASGAPSAAESATTPARTPGPKGPAIKSGNVRPAGAPVLPAPPPPPATRKPPPNPYADDPH